MPFQLFPPNAEVFSDLGKTKPPRVPVAHQSLRGHDRGWACRYNPRPLEPATVLVEIRIDQEVLRRLVARRFEDMVKYVVDVERDIAAVGASCTRTKRCCSTTGAAGRPLGGERLPRTPPRKRIEYTSLINIRPAQGNRSLTIEDPAVRERVRAITLALIGEGEPLG